MKATTVCIGRPAYAHVSLRTGSNTAAHLNPLCPRLGTTEDTHSRAVAVRAMVDAGRVTVGALTVPLCSSCRGWSAPDDSWKARAFCSDGRRPPYVPHDLWFCFDRHSRRLAARLCAACPVRDECLAYSAECRFTEGMWAGCAGSTLRDAQAARRRGAA